LTERCKPSASPAIDNDHWGTCHPLDSNFVFFSGRFKAAQTLTVDSMWLPTQKEYTGLQLCHCLLHECENIFVCHP